MPAGARGAGLSAERARGAAIAALCLCHVAQYYSVVSVYSYVGYLAAHNGWALVEDSNNIKSIAQNDQLMNF